MHLRASIAGVALAVAALCTVAWAGCGGGDPSRASAPSAAESAIPESAPKIELPKGPPPTKLIVRDLQKGTGSIARKDDEVELQYYGVEWGTGIKHSNSWGYSYRPTFDLQERTRMVPGLRLAIPGMREGGGREVIIPADLRYNTWEEHSPVDRRDALIYKVYLVEVLD